MYGDHRDLHSFPTRRSSDLPRPAVGLDDVAVHPERALAELRALRSEEHTSELQSQSNLVCRLLLEKKISLIALFLNAVAACTVGRILAGLAPGNRPASLAGP